MLFMSEMMSEWGFANKTKYALQQCYNVYLLYPETIGDNHCNIISLPLSGHIILK
jgi:hypothetical protein